MSDLMDFLDDYLLGPLNLLDYLEGLMQAVIYRDAGHEIAIPRVDKGGAFSLNEVRALLRRYGIATYGRRFDANHMYIRVKKRQARWAEYILLRAGVELHNPLYEGRNPGWAARHRPGELPPAWADRQRSPTGKRRASSSADAPVTDWLARLRTWLE